MPRRYITIALLLLAGCSSQMLPVLPGLKPYRMDVQQGNVVTQEMIAKVQPGMTRSQVRFALGTPLVVDPFRIDRWDYVYFYQKAGKITDQRWIAVLFKDDRLVRIEGDVLPASAAGTTPPAKSDMPVAPAPAAAPPPANPDAPTAPAPAALPQAQPELK